MRESYRLFACFALLTSCSAPPPASPTANADPTLAASYKAAVAQLQSMNREASAAYHSGKPDQAAKIMEQEKPLVAEVLAPPRPSLDAALAAGDLDQLYGDMLLANRHYGWARIKYQENLARWKHWHPATPETTRRLQLAQSSIDECDRHILQ